MDKKKAPSKATSLVEVKVAPKQNPSRWHWFFKWFRKIEKTPEAQYAKEKVTEYIDARVEGGIEAARTPGLANFKTQAEIGKIVRESQVAEDDNRRKNSRFEAELKSLELDNQVKEAEVRKLNAETHKIKTDTNLRLLEEIENRGFKVAIELDSDGTPRLIVIDERKNLIDKKEFDQYGVKSLKEYIESARIPEVYGVSGRVVEVLTRRIGKKPLAIDYIAEELNASKKTLQEHLKEQNISFAQLRDQVRFHYAIDFLVNKTLNIDGVSMALDFSDRKSFTNAFKRWTNLSPSTFRKLFKDYI